MKLEDKLNGLIESYYQNKQSLDNYKALTDEQNAEIKSIMNELGIEEYTTLGGQVAKYSIQKRESFNEDLLLQKIKELGFDDIIRTKEYVDMDGLENLIYTGELKANALNRCRIVKEVETLRVSKKKGA